MATKKTTKRDAKKTKTTRVAKEVKTEKAHFFSTVGRALSAHKEKRLARGTHIQVLGEDKLKVDMSGFRIRIGTPAGAVYEGSFVDFIEKMTRSAGYTISIDQSGAPIPDPSADPSTPTG